MSYFNPRSRANSKPIKDEFYELNHDLNHDLSKIGTHKLKFNIDAARGQYTDAAHMLMGVMTEANSNSSPQLQSAHHPHQPTHQEQKNIFCNLAPSLTGLPSPIDTSEDSEMSGTENIHPYPHHRSQQLPAIPSSFTLGTLAFAYKPSRKRKFLTEKDDNIPPSSPNTTPFSSKRSKRNSTKFNPSPNHTSKSPDESTCLNCGHLFALTSNLHNCIFHPGSRSTIPQSSSTNCNLPVDWRNGSWSCCGSSLRSPGCLITRHRDAPGSWRFKQASAAL